jgi:hypothetical protein
LPRFDNLPGAHDSDSPVTLDLNGRVTLRAWGEDQPRPLELLLSNCSAGGEPASVCMNRHYLARALRLGLGQLLLDHSQDALRAGERLGSDLLPLLRQPGFEPKHPQSELSGFPGSRDKLV